MVYRIYVEKKEGLANFVTEYLFCKFVVFRGQENTLDTKKEHKE